MANVPKDNKPEDQLESILRLFEIGGKAFSFIVPSVYKLHGDFMSELLYACGNFASTVRKLYHSGMLLRTLRDNTASFLKKFIETFEVVVECCAYKFGSKRMKWTVILLLQAFKLLLRLYLTHVRQIVLDDRCDNAAAAAAFCRCRTDQGRRVGGGDSDACQNRPRLAELLHSGRPLLHTCLYLWRGKHAWLPWAASAAADILSLSCVPSGACLTRRQLECRSDRFKAAALAYVFRTPFHDVFVRPVAEWLANCPVPLANSFFKLVLSYLVYWRLYYMNMWS